MKQPYTPPTLEIIIFSPLERLADDSVDTNMDLRKLTDLSRSAGVPTPSIEGDIFIPFW